METSLVRASTLHYSDARSLGLKLSIGESGGKAIAEVMVKSHTLRCLSLSHCELGTGKRAAKHQRIDDDVIYVQRR